MLKIQYRLSPSGRFMKRSPLTYLTKLNPSLERTRESGGGTIMSKISKRQNQKDLLIIVKKYFLSALKL